MFFRACYTAHKGITRRLLQPLYASVYQYQPRYGYLSAISPSSTSRLSSFQNYYTTKMAEVHHPNNNNKPAAATASVEEVTEVSSSPNEAIPTPRETSFLVNEPEPDVKPSSGPGHAPLPLPAPSDASPEQPENRTTTVEVNGQAIILDHLGPMVINRDGTMSRIANWPEMTPWERENTLRVLGKRNQLRLSNLRADKEKNEGKQSDGESKYC